MTDLVTKYRKQSYRMIEWGLRKRDVPEEIIMQTVEQLRKDRAELARTTLSRRRNRAAWAEIIEALQHERRIVRTMLKYQTKEPAPERDAFVADYYHVLNELHARLTAKKREAKPPEHSHWVDFVPARIKTAFEDELNAIPVRARARVKQPFERRLPLLVYDRRKARLLRSTRSELKTAKERGDTDRADLLQTAIDIIHEIPEGEHIPNTWHPLVKKTDDEEELG
jgi:hypothetical protein